MKLYKFGLVPMLLLAFASGPVLADDDDEGHEGRSRRLAPLTNAKWKAECGSCHALYHPGLLPARSWRKMMSGLDKHFEQDASVDAPTNKEISDFLTKYGADSRFSRFERAMPASEAPLRITETARFKREHREIAPGVWKRQKIGSPANCAACHPGAEQGDFSEHRVRIPR